ncbi:uncharacterized protein LODBEIA_P02950 [Lodderomyces beijingensis]|uniref:Protein kinase domain-containing protein n=1 Tax=Lodderomyces beijingensis TaxID=1775926 RepID=A0ABP0ZD22_9ASCO
MPIVENFKKLFNNNINNSTTNTNTNTFTNNSHNNYPTTAVSKTNITSSHFNCKRNSFGGYSTLGHRSSPDLTKLEEDDKSILSSVISNDYSHNIMKDTTISNPTIATTVTPCYSVSSPQMVLGTGTGAGDTFNTNNNSTASFTFDASLHESYPDLPPNFRIIGVLGEGAFSTVYKAVDLNSNTPVAIKIISKAHLTSKQFHNIKNEIKIMKRIHHPNVLQLLNSFDTEDHCFLILEYCNGGEIFNKIIEYTYFSEPLSRHVFRQLLSAIDNLHRLNIVHRDIKPENLLFKKIPYYQRSSDECRKALRRSDETSKIDEGEFKANIGGGTIGMIKLADFGLAKQLVDEIDQSNVPLKTPCGTAGYTAPEVITCNARNTYSNFSKKSKNHYSKAVDIWSLGCFLYTIMCGFPPFYEDETNDVTMKIINGDFVFLQPWWDEISNEAKDLITKMLNVNPEERITIEEIWRHPWVTEGNSEFMGMGGNGQGEGVELTNYFQQGFEVSHVEDISATSDSLPIPMSNQPILSPRARAIKTVFDNPAMLGDNFKEPSSQFIENIDEEDEDEDDDEEDEEDDGDDEDFEPIALHDTHGEYVRTPFPKEFNFKNVFNIDKSQIGADVDADADVNVGVGVGVDVDADADHEDDFDDEISELEDEVASLQLTPKLVTRARSNSNGNSYIHNGSASVQNTFVFPSTASSHKLNDREEEEKEEEDEEEDSTTNSNSDNDVSEYQTRSSSIISGIGGDYKFTMNLNDSNLLARRKSSLKGNAPGACSTASSSITTVKEVEG